MVAERTENNKSTNVVKIAPEKLFGIAEIMFDQGKQIVLTVTGNSMYPFLRNNTDSVEIRRIGINDIKVSDIVLVKRSDDVYILHRVFKKTGGIFYMVGDAQTNLDGPYDKTNLIGKVTSVIRNGKNIPCSSLTLRFLVRFWMVIRPVRLSIINGYLKFRNRNGKIRRKNV